eukprot:TRINITY_DN4276_c0_g1_i2.p1 TRINITY_DN4276_c0_g1~~TRINITY_DN4276_c0_g1_i2.p1  ORF type:complete len:129 (-),score=28.67 TRINITY_DN4276_c0_g1_i2:133-519(-)
MSVRATGPTNFSSINQVIDHFTLRGVALIYGGNYTKSSLARSVFIKFIFNSPSYIYVELIIERKKREFDNSLSSQIFIEMVIGLEATIITFIIIEKKLPGHVPSHVTRSLKLTTLKQKQQQQQQQQQI